MFGGCHNLFVFTYLQNFLDYIFPIINHLFHSRFLLPDQLLKRNPDVKELLTTDVFQFDTGSQALCVRSSSTQFARHPTVSKRVTLLISSHQLLLKPFFSANTILLHALP